QRAQAARRVARGRGDGGIRVGGVDGHGGTSYRYLPPIGAARESARRGANHRARFGGAEGASSITTWRSLPLRGSTRGAALSAATCTPATPTRVRESRNREHAPC